MILGSGSSPGEGIGYPHHYSWASLVAQTVKNLPAMQETWVQFLDWEDPLEEGMGKHSSILALKIPWTEEPGRLQSVGCKESEMTERLSRPNMIKVKKKNQKGMCMRAQSLRHVQLL